MANNKSTIKQIPLNMSINMNKNQSLVDSSWSMVNKINSPVYGGTITNIHAKTVATGDAIWDKKGERYYVENNVLKSTNPQWKDIDLSDKFYFKKEVLSEDFDNLIKQDDYYYAVKNIDGTAKIYKGTDFNDLSLVGTAAEEDRNIQACRLVSMRVNNGQWPFTLLVTVQEMKAAYVGNAADSIQTQLTVYKIEGSNITKAITVPLYLGSMTSAGYNSTKTFTNFLKNNTGTANTTSQTNNNGYQIILSSLDFSTNGKTDVNSSFILGISILQHKMRGENTKTSLKFDNVIIKYLANPDVISDSSSTDNGKTPYSFQALNCKRLIDDGTENWEPTAELKFENRYTVLTPMPLGNIRFFSLHNDKPFYKGSGVDLSEMSYTNSDANVSQYTFVGTDQEPVKGKDNLSFRGNGIFLDDTPYIVATDMCTANNSNYQWCLGTVSKGSIFPPLDPFGYGFLTGDLYDNDLRDDINLYYPKSSRVLTPLLTGFDSNNLALDSTTHKIKLDNIINNPNNDTYKFAGFKTPRVKFGAAYPYDGSACLTTNQRYTRLVWYGEATDKDVSGENNIASGLFDISKPDSIFASVGLQSEQTIPTTKSAWDSFRTKSNTDSTYVCWNSVGSITKIGNTNWRLLFNYRQGYISGISYGQDNHLGKLVTEWDSIDDGFYVYAEEDFVLYRNARDRKIYKVSRLPYNNSLLDFNPLKMFQIIDDRYLIGNIDIEHNCFDIVTDKYNNWANDWNGRVIPGLRYTVFDQSFWDQTNDYDNRSSIEVTASGFTNYVPTQVFKYLVSRTWKTCQYDCANNWVNNGTIASGQNVLYTSNKTFAPSRIDAYTTLIGFVKGYETFLYAASEDGIDFFSVSSVTAPSYQYTVKTDANGSTYTEANTVMEGKTYPVAQGATAYYNLPITGVDFIESYNGKFAVKIDNTVYGIVYNGVRPIGLYNTASLTDDIDEFFIVQGQYYAVVNGYISAVYYSSNGTLNNIEQIIDVNGMKFIGAFPSVAYFWAPSTQSIYAFTGDADLQLFVQSNRIETVYNYLYDPASEWILLNTNDGLYVMTQINVYKTTRIYDVSDFFSTDDGYVVVIWDSDKKNTKLGLRKWETDWTTVPVELSTAFYGIGDTKKSVVDCWYIRLYRNDEDYNGIVTLRTDTLNDIVVKGKEKTEKLTKDKWDINDNCLIRFQPNNQHSLGTSLNIVSDYPIVSIMASVTEDAAVQSKVNI